MISWAKASDGREAVQLARSLVHDISVLDISMPVLRGIDAADEILQDAPDSHDAHGRSVCPRELASGVSGFL